MSANESVAMLGNICIKETWYKQGKALFPTSHSSHPKNSRYATERSGGGKNTEERAQPLE